MVFCCSQFWDDWDPLQHVENRYFYTAKERRAEGIVRESVYTNTHLHMQTTHG